MTNLKTLFERIEQNQQVISQHGKFDDALLKKVNYRLRLDWNYYSNRIEGGTLTKAETRSVMVGNIDVKGKPLRDIMEMSGHDKLVIDILKMSKGELTLAEKRIKDIHRAIMHEEDNEKQKFVGNWKQEDNEIINYKNEKISFTNWREVPDSIHQLLDKTNAQLEQYHKGKSTLHAVEIAAQFHVDFITIHPFYDGNGRTTRILTNILLMACGYPAIIIKDQHKKSYYQLLGDIQAYRGNTNLFYEFLAERVIDTQELVLHAIAGKDIEEDNEIDKLIHQAKLELSQKAGVIEHTLSKKSAGLLLDSCIKESFQYVLDKALAFEDEFIRFSKHIDFQINHSGRSVGNENSLDIVIQNMHQMLSSEMQNIGSLLVGMNISLNGFKRSNVEKNSFIQIKFYLTEMIGKIEILNPIEPVQVTFYYNELNGGTTFTEIKKQINTVLAGFVKHIVSLAE